MTKTFVGLLLFTLSLHLHAQPLVCAGKTYPINEFSSDTVALTDGQAVEGRLLAPIRQSAYDLDIRIYFGSLELGAGEQLLCIQGNRDSMIVSLYHSLILNRLVPLKKYHVMKIAEQRYFYYEAKRLPYGQTPGYLLQRLINDHFFTLQDELQLLQTFKARGVKPTGYAVMDCCGDNLVEIKLQGRYHSFYYNEQNHTLYPRRKELASNRAAAQDINAALKLFND